MIGGEISKIKQKHRAWEWKKRANETRKWDTAEVCGTGCEKNWFPTVWRPAAKATPLPDPPFLSLLSGCLADPDLTMAHFFLFSKIYLIWSWHIVIVPICGVHCDILIHDILMIGSRQHHIYLPMPVGMEPRLLHVESWSDYWYTTRLDQP